MPGRMAKAGDVPFHDADQTIEAAGTPQKRDSDSALCLDFTALER